MKTFLALYTGQPGAFERRPMSDDQRAAGMQAWSDWMQRHAAAIVDSGGPLGRTKRAAADGIADTRNQIAAYVIIRAESHDAAAAMFEQHPHFAIFPGDAVEIMECLPVPGAS